MLTILHHQCKKKSPFFFLYYPRDFSSLLSPTSLIYHQWISCTFLTFSPLILSNKMNCNLYSPRHFLNPLRSCFQVCPQFGSNKLFKFFSIGLDLLARTTGKSTFHSSVRQEHWDWNEATTSHFHLSSVSTRHRSHTTTQLFSPDATSLGWGSETYHRHQRSNIPLNYM